MSLPVLPDRLTAGRTVLVVVDIQEKFRDLIHGMDQVLANTGRLISFCQQLEIPIITTEHYPRGLGVTVPEIRNLCSPFDPIEKIDFSCAGCAPFNRALAALKRDQVILCGIETHVCIYQTAFDLLRQGKQVVAAVDAVSSCSAANRELGLVHMSRLGVQNMGTQMLMFEILQKAGSPAFKAVANILKD
jgi:nicotinamidase-related amidase